MERGFTRRVALLGLGAVVVIALPLGWITASLVARGGAGITPQETQVYVWLAVVIGLLALYGVLVALSWETYRALTRNRILTASLYGEKMKQLTERDQAFMGTIEAIATAVDARDPHTSGHSQRVTEYALAIAGELGITDESELYQLRWAATLHDIGMVGIPEAILCKPDGLTPSEYTDVQRHANIGYRMLRHIPPLQSYLAAVRYHHERWDGGGYPSGLAGVDIPLGAQIISVADCLDAITTGRAYRPPRTFEEARREIARQAGEQFSPAVADALGRLIDDGRLQQPSPGLSPATVGS